MVMGFYHENCKGSERGRILILAPFKLREEDLITLWSENGTFFFPFCSFLVCLFYFFTLLFLFSSSSSSSSSSSFLFSYSSFFFSSSFSPSSSPPLLLPPPPVFVHFFLSNTFFPCDFFLSSCVPCLLVVSFNINLQWKYPESGVSVHYRECPKLVCRMQCSMLCLYARHDQKILEFFVQYFLWIECVKLLLFL